MLLWRPAAVSAGAVGALVGAELGIFGAFASGWTAAGLWAGAGVAAAADLLAGLLLAWAGPGRVPVTAAVVGWFAPVLVLSSGRAKGDVVVQGNARGWAFLLLGALAFVPGGVWGARRGRGAGPATEVPSATPDAGGDR